MRPHSQISQKMRGKKSKSNAFGDRQNQKSSDFKPRLLISVWALLKWSLYSSTSIEARNGISAALKKKNPEAKRASDENVQEEMERLGQAGRALSGWWSSALTGRWLMRRWCAAGHVHCAHSPVNWLSLAHQTTCSWPNLVQNTHPNYLLRVEAPSGVVLVVSENFRNF